MVGVKNAVRLLIKDGRTINREALEVLQSAPDPVGLAKTILAVTPSGTNVSRELLVHQLRSSHTKKIHKPISVKPKVRTNSPNLTRSKLLGGLLPTKPKTSANHQPSIPASMTRINTTLEELNQELHNYESSLEIIRNPQLSEKLVGDINDMVGYFQDRYKKLSRLFRGRSDITNVVKIKDIKQEHSDISVIGMVTEKSFTTETSARLTLEDPNSSAVLEALIHNNETLVEQALQIMTDSVICLKGWVNNYSFFIREIVLPDVPYSREKKRAEVPVHAAFLSDIHIGSHGFLSDPMEKFIQFLNGEYGNKKLQKLGSMTKYVLFAGDVVDGVGIYPNQLADLAIDSIQDQYNSFASFVDQIPDDVEVVVIPGNHDMVRSAEPQPVISPEFAPDLHGIENVHMLPNPSQVALHGIQTLLYHCTSLPDIMNHIPGLPIEKPVEVMIHMLKARHLAPIWGDKTPIATEPEDHLVIDPLPDIFHGGHVHINGLGGYRGVQIVNSGTMQEQTSYQKSLNIDPTPGQVPIINLQSRLPSLVDFMTK